jgi:dTDP-4-amino-4,6-dideoxygalactose transaminase
VLALRHGEIAAVLGTHTFGVPPPVAEQKRWQELCREHGIPLVVDAAAGFGAEDDTGARTGHSEAAHVFSFHATKPFGIGEGGAIATLDDDLLARCNSIREFGFGKDKLATSVGINAKLDELHAATALALPDRYGDVLRRRREIVERYREALEPHGFALQSGHEGGTWQAAYLVAPDAATRSAVVAAASAASVGVRTSYYDTPLHRHPVFAGAEAHGDLAVTDDLAARALALPMANDLGGDDVERVIDVVLSGRRSA